MGNDKFRFRRARDIFCGFLKGNRQFILAACGWRICAVVARSVDAGIFERILRVSRMSRHYGRTRFCAVNPTLYVDFYKFRKIFKNDAIILKNNNLRFVRRMENISDFVFVVPVFLVAVDRLFVQNDIRAREVALYVHGFLGYGLVAIVWQLHRTVHIDRRLLENRSHNISVPGNRSRIQVEYRRFLSSDAASCFI